MYGTDLGNGDIPPGVHTREALPIREAGLEPEEVLETTIRAPLEPDAPADSIALAASPLEDLAALDDVRRDPSRAGRRRLALGHAGQRGRQVEVSAGRDGVGEVVGVQRVGEPRLGPAAQCASSSSGSSSIRARADVVAPSSMAARRASPSAEAATSSRE